MGVDREPISQGRIDRAWRGMVGNQGEEADLRRT